MEGEQIRAAEKRGRDVSLTFIIKSINSVDGGTLVVPSEKEEVFRIFDFVCQKKANGLETLLSSIDVVAKEEVIGLGGESTVLEQAQEILILAVDVACWFQKKRSSSSSSRERGDF